MADFLLCLDSGCGIDLTNNSGRLGAAVRPDTERGLKCDPTSRNLYVGTRGFAAQADPTSETGCDNLLEIDTNGDLWVPPTLSYCTRNYADPAFLQWPAQGSSDDHADILLWTNNTNCRQIVEWEYERVQVSATAAASVNATGIQMIADYNLFITQILGGAGGVGTNVAERGTMIATRDAAQVFTAGSVLRGWTQLSGVAILNPGGTLTHDRGVTVAQRAHIDAGAASAANGVSFTQLSVKVHTGYEAP